MEQWCRDAGGYRYRCGRKAAEFLQSGINGEVQCTDEPANWIVVGGYAKDEGRMSGKPHKKRDDDGRMVAECVRVGEFLRYGPKGSTKPGYANPLNFYMVSGGWAFNDPDYDPDYSAAERSARESEYTISPKLGVKGQGMWAGEFVFPWEWCKGARLDGGK